MEIRFPRLITMSLHVHIRHFFAMELVEEPLVPFGDDNKSFCHSFFEMWSYTRPVSVYVNDELVDNSEYEVFFNPKKEGDRITPAHIRFRNELSDTDKVSANFWANHVPIKPSYVGEYHAPFLVIDVGPYVPVGWELGGTDMVSIQFLADICADSEGQRDDLTDMFIEVLKRDADLIDFNLGFPIDEDGRTNPEYNHDAQKIGTIYFSDISVTPNPSGSGEEEEKNRCLVTFNASSLRSWNTKV